MSSEVVFATPSSAPANGEFSPEYKNTLQKLIIGEQIT